MTEALIWIVILAALGSGIYVAVQNPKFWLEFGGIVFTAILPKLLKRMSPEKEQEWRNLQARSADKDDYDKFYRKWHDIEKGK